MTDNTSRIMNDLKNSISSWKTLTLKKDIMTHSLTNKWSTLSCKDGRLFTIISRALVRYNYENIAELDNDDNDLLSLETPTITFRTRSNNLMRYVTSVYCDYVEDFNVAGEDVSE